MGMDVYGIKPKSAIGEYFRNNCWYWSPLWEFICSNCEDILTEKQMAGGNYNDGTKITEEQAEQIFLRIQEIDKKDLIKIEAEDIEQREMAKENNKDKAVGDKDYIWSANYPFDAKNVMEFADFCKASGGFEIY